MIGLEQMSDPPKDGFAVAKIRVQKSEVGLQRSDTRGPRTENRGQRSAASDQLSKVRSPSSAICPPPISIALLTGGGDKPYALGIAEALTSVGISVDFIGSDD